MAIRVCTICLANLKGLIYCCFCTFFCVLWFVCVKINCPLTIFSISQFSATVGGENQLRDLLIKINEVQVYVLCLAICNTTLSLFTKIQKMRNKNHTSI